MICRFAVHMHQYMICRWSMEEKFSCCLEKLPFLKASIPYNSIVLWHEALAVNIKVYFWNSHCVIKIINIYVDLNLTFWHSRNQPKLLMFFHFIKCFTTYPDFASEGMLLPVFAAGFAGASAHCHKAVGGISMLHFCSFSHGACVPQILKLIHFQTDRSSDYRFPPNIIPFEWFRLVSGTKNLGIFDFWWNWMSHENGLWNSPHMTG